MDIYTYLIPKEIFAQIIVVFLLLFFFYWIISLLRQKSRLKKISSQINNCEKISELSDVLRKRYWQNDETSLEKMEMISPGEAALKFEAFCKEKKIPENSPLYKHLIAIFFTGFNESQLNVETLIKNTTSRIIAPNTTLRYLISLFIILGLLGTLSGLVSSLYELSAILPDTQMTDESLKTGLKTLLGKLSGSFTPSFLGVFFTVVSMLFFAFLQKYSYRVLQSLEHQTLTNWVPNLIPTPSQRMLDKLHLGEKQVKEMAEFTSKVSSETSELRTNIKEAGSTLKGFTESAAKLATFTDSFTRNLDGFAQNFKESVDRLAPVSEKFTELYQNILADSSKFQENVKQTLDDSQAFRSQVQQEFEQQSKQLEALFNSMKLYETVYLENRQSTDEKVQATLAAAEQALGNLSRQNEVFVTKLIETVGTPLREELKAELVNVTEALKDITVNSNTMLNQITTDSTTTLTELSQNISGEIQSVATRLGQLENPLKNSADFIEATATTFESRTQKFLEEIRREFQNQNQQKENENINLEKLNDNIQNLENLNGNIQKLASEITDLTNKVGKLNQIPVGKPKYQERKKEPDSPQVYVPEQKQGFFKKWFNKIRRR